MLIILAAAIAQQAALKPFKQVSVSISPNSDPRHRNGTNIFRVTVSPEGIIFRCETEAHGKEVFADKDICKTLKKLKANPALDQDQRPSYGMIQFTVDWHAFNIDGRRDAVNSNKGRPDYFLPVSRLPTGTRPDTSSTLILITGADGKPETCEIQVTSGTEALDNAACRVLTLSGIAPLKNETGTPVRAIQTVRVGFFVKP